MEDKSASINKKLRVLPVLSFLTLAFSVAKQYLTVYLSAIAAFGFVLFAVFKGLVDKYWSTSEQEDPTAEATQESGGQKVFRLASNIFYLLGVVSAILLASLQSETVSHFLFDAAATSPVTWGLALGFFMLSAVSWFFSDRVIGGQVQVVPVTYNVTDLNSSPLKVSSAPAPASASGQSPWSQVHLRAKEEVARIKSENQANSDAVDANVLLPSASVLTSASGLPISASTLTEGSPSPGRPIGDVGYTPQTPLSPNAEWVVQTPPPASPASPAS